MDLDSDGQMDVITGSYWPGHIYWFRGLGKGEFAAGVVLQDSDGAELHAGEKWKSEDEPDMRSLAAVPVALDWDGDGDLDLLVGNIGGSITRIDNVGDARKPVFGKARHAVLAGGEELRVDGDAGPALADWDGDGKVDLLVGADSGCVVFCRNVGDGRRVELAAPVELLGKSAQGWDPVPEGGEPKGHGVRAKVHAADWNGDGLLDLLVGDCIGQSLPAPELTPEQVEQRDALRKQRDELQEKLGKLYEDGPPKGLFSKLKARTLQMQVSKCYEQLRPLEQQDETHGFVWVYLRKKEAAVAGR